MDFKPIIDTLMRRLYPLNRSLTGEDNRKTLRLIREIIPLNILEYASGTNVYDWTVPDEWNVKDAWIKNSKGKKVVDFKESNLHLVSYSVPIHETMSYKKISKKLFFLEDLPDAIPYRTSYYKKDWGFCIAKSQFDTKFMENEKYEVLIDSSLAPGSMSIGEFLIKGKSEKEILVSSYICHPSMANDSLSGVVLSVCLAKYLYLKRNELQHSYRFVFLPETIGAVAYLFKNEEIMRKIDCGFVITTVGGKGVIGFKSSFDPTHEINGIANSVLSDNVKNYVQYPFDIRGSDERQYSSQQFRINTVSITKDKYYEYSYYHTSLDNLQFVETDSIMETLKIYCQVTDLLDLNIKFKNTSGFGEPMLSKYDLYPHLGGSAKFHNGRELTKIDIILWLLHYCDGNKSLYEISIKMNVPIKILYEVGSELVTKGLLSKSSE